MKRRSLTSRAVAVLCSVVLAPEVAAGPVSGNLSRTGPPGADAASVQIDVTCLGEPDKPEKPTKPTDADKAGKPDKATKPERAENTAKSYKASAKIPGPYSVNVEEQGDCTLTVQYQGMTASIAIVSEKGAVRYDLVFSIVDGKLRIRRQ